MFFSSSAPKPLSGGTVEVELVEGAGDNGGGEDDRTDGGVAGDTIEGQAAAVNAQQVGNKARSVRGDHEGPGHPFGSLAVSGIER